MLSHHDPKVSCVLKFYKLSNGTFFGSSDAHKVCNFDYYYFLNDTTHCKKNVCL